jgi:hypothetical protein
MLAPVSAAEVANPARRLCPENSAGSRPRGQGIALHHPRQIDAAQALRLHRAPALQRPEEQPLRLSPMTAACSHAWTWSVPVQPCPQVPSTPHGTADALTGGHDRPREPALGQNAFGGRRVKDQARRPPSMAACTPRAKPQPGSPQIPECSNAAAVPYRAAAKKGPGAAVASWGLL